MFAKSDAVKYSLESIDRYTGKEYNDYCWIAVNEVLTRTELKKLYFQFSDLRDFPQNDSSEMIEVLISYDSSGFYNAHEIVEAYAGKKVFGIYTLQDYKTYRKLKNERSGS